MLAVEMQKLGRRWDGSVFTIVAWWLVLRDGADTGDQEGSVADSDMWCEECRLWQNVGAERGHRNRVGGWRRGCSAG